MSPLTQKLTKAGILIGTGLLMLGFSAANAESYPDRPIGVMKYRRRSVAIQRCEKYPPAVSD